MPWEVRATPVAEAQINALRGTVRKALTPLLEHLGRRGCAAMGYRLTGPVLEHLCVAHIHRSWRMVVAFAPDEVIWVLLVGEHTADEEINIYDALYRLIGHEPEPIQKRTKPPCCGDDGSAPEVDEDLVLEWVARTRALTRRRR